ncbi:MAG TPA: pitrilysin family protein [Thermoanaerobaculia bacterium]|nr:pitrilysin family protein [Thermoanaerobaculia bacterium]
MKVAAVALFLAGAWAPPAFAHPALARIHERGATGLYRMELSNGLIAVIDARPGRRTVYCEIGVRVGSRNETLALAGISHLLEHLLFKEGEGPGARKNPAFSKIRAAGGDVNATTDFERTNYFCDVIGDAFEEGWRGLASLVTGAAFDAHDVDVERRVVLEEAARDKNNPVAIAAYSVLKRAFPDDPLSQPVLGYRKTLDRITYGDVKAYYGRFYAPGNAYALIVGDVEPERAAELVAETLGTWQGLSRRPQTFPPPPRVAPDRAFAFRTLVEQVYYALGVLTPGHSASDHMATELLRRVLGEGKTSRLYRRLVEQEGLTTEFLTGKYDLSNLGIFAAGGAVDPDHAERFQAILREEFDRIVREPVGADELDLARRLFSADLVREFETNEGIAAFRSERLLYGLPVSRDADLEAAAKLTPQDLLSTARTYFAPEKLREIEVAPARGFGKVIAILRFLIFRTI